MHAGERAMRDADHGLLPGWDGDPTPRGCAAEHPPGVCKPSARSLWHHPAELPTVWRAQAADCGDLQWRFDLLIGAGLHSMADLPWHRQPFGPAAHGVPAAGAAAH